MKTWMQKLEDLTGSKHVLDDEWDSLGWEFANLPGTNERVCVLYEYAECKAEGCTVIFTVIDEYAPMSAQLIVMRVKGGGIHGVPGQESVLGVDPLKVGEFETNLTPDDLAARMREWCEQEWGGYIDPDRTSKWIDA